mgnify:CR=1 FL=1
MGEETTIMGTVLSVVFQNEENGYAVLRLVTDDGELLTLVGCVPCAAPGEELILTGRYTTHPQHGEQFAADEVEQHMPTGETEILNYLASGVVRGIGPATAQKLVDRFGADTLDVLDGEPEKLKTIKGITDKGYITNSYHVNVTEEIDAFTKLEFEAQFQHLSPGGAISYVEVPDMQNNIPAVLEVMKFIYDNIIYAELNTKSDYCQVCGWDGEIDIVEEGGKLIWRCPKCGNTDQDKMNVARRTCGYIGTQYWNQGRTQEIRDRVLHL